MVTDTPPADANFHVLLRWHLERGTEPYKPFNPDWKWTHDSFATATRQSNRETVTQWVALSRGKLPKQIGPILDALFGKDPALAEARERLQKLWQAAKDARLRGAAAQLGAAPTLGVDWARPTDPHAPQSLAPVPASDVEDPAAADRPMFRQRLPVVQRKVAALRDVARALHNASQDYDELYTATNDLAGYLEGGAEALLCAVGAAYEAVLTIGSYVEMDNRRRASEAADNDILDDARRRVLDDTYKSIAALLAGIPSVQHADAQLNGMLLRRDLLAPARSVTRAAVDTNLISRPAGGRVESQISAAERGDYQGAKAGTRGIAAMKRMLVRGAALAADAHAERGDDSGDIANRFRATIERAPEAAGRLIGDMPPAEAGAVAEVVEVLTGLPVLGSFRPPLTPLVRWHEPVGGVPPDLWPEMVTLPAGRFVMGAPKREKESDEDERPQREVRLPRPFALGRYAVTFAQWDGANAAGAGLPVPKDQGWGRGDRPVINISWSGARAYCAWLNRVVGVSGLYRLPTEAEWEYGCRAGSSTAFSFGATISTEQANYDGNSVYGRGRKGEYRGQTVPVGTFPSNDWGLHEMHGNVWEWVEDAYGASSADGLDGSVAVTGDGAAPRVLRGGSWLDDPWDLRSATRSRNNPGSRDSSVGFRLARTL